jgi:hypothetical protein
MNQTIAQPMKMRTAYWKPDGGSGVAGRLPILEAMDHLQGALTNPKEHYGARHGHQF